MDFFKSLRQSFLKFNHPEAISKQLATLIKRLSLKTLKKSKRIPWILGKV